MHLRTLLCFGGPHRREVRVLHSLRGGESLVVVVLQQAIQELQRVLRGQVGVVGGHEAVPGLLAVRAHDGLHVRVELQVVLVQIVEQVVSAQHLLKGKNVRKRVEVG